MLPCVMPSQPYIVHGPVATNFLLLKLGKFNVTSRLTRAGYLEDRVLMLVNRAMYEAFRLRGISHDTGK